MKTTFVKADPVLITYRYYKNYNSNTFNFDLQNNLSENNDKDYRKFQNIVCDVLNHHAPLKQKKIRANNSPFMTKELRKMIMNRSRYKNAYYKKKLLKTGKDIEVLGMNVLR